MYDVPGRSLGLLPDLRLSMGDSYMGEPTGTIMV